MKKEKKNKKINRNKNENDSRKTNKIEYKENRKENVWWNEKEKGMIQLNLIYYYHQLRSSWHESFS